MNAREIASRRVDQVCAVWASASSVEPVERVGCRSGITLSPTEAMPRFCFVSAASPIEKLLGVGATIFNRGGTPLVVAELFDRLVDGEVAAVVTSGRTDRQADDLTLPPALLDLRAALRRANVRARFLLRQIGLEEVSAHRGAPVRLYDDIAALWTLHLSLFTDPAMLLTLGADRQRYVDTNYTERATDRLPRALGRLHDLGVRSYPRLVII